MRLLYVVPPLEALGGVSRSAGRMIAAMGERHSVVVASPDPDLFPGDVLQEAAGVGERIRIGADSGPGPGPGSRRRATGGMIAAMRDDVRIGADSGPGPGSRRRATGGMIAAMRERRSVVVTSPDPDLFPGDVRIGAHSGPINERVRFGIVEPWVVEDWVPVVAEAIRASHAEVVFGYYGTTAGAAAVAAARIAGVASVLCLRGNDVDRDADDPVRGAVLSAAIEHATVVATVSTEMAATVQARFGREATFVQSAVDRERFWFDAAGAEEFRRTFALTQPVLGMFGELKEKRGLDRLACPELELELDRWQVVLVGRVRPEARQHVRERWTLVPYLEDDRLRAAYSACDVVLQPSHRDGMPNVVLEAMACARTVVASRVGGLPDLIENGLNGLLFSEEEELAALLRNLRERPRPELGERAREQAPTIEHERAAMEALAAEALERRKERHG